ncbi:MAG: hypothetical protein PHD05_00015 [Sphaerochaetaceae bacterium]|nr:hypothetical protein [Sphaerochaetaceae bacterium]
MLEIIKDINPDIIATINPEENIIFCTPNNDIETLSISDNLPYSYNIRLNKDINLSSPEIVKISESVLSFNFFPSIKISIPNGLMLDFITYNTSTKNDIFRRIYKSFDVDNVLNEQEIITHNFITNMRFKLYVDMIRLREESLPLTIKSGTIVSTICFNWYVVKLPVKEIKNIYLIKDQQIFKDFINIF